MACYRTRLNATRRHQTQGVGAFEDDIQRILDLHEAPVVAAAKLFDDRAERFDQGAQARRQYFDLEVAHQGLGLGPVPTRHESVVGRLNNALSAQLVGQPL